MLEKPDIPDELIISRLQEEYNFKVAQLSFLPIGADLRTAVYRVVANDEAIYFLKLRKRFDEVIVRIPLLLRARGVQEIIVPLVTKSQQHWADFGDFKVILFPFIEGKDGFEIELTDQQRQTLGTALKGIHSTDLPPELKGRVRIESFSSEWRDSLKAFQAQVEVETFADPTAARLAAFMKSQRSEIDHLLARAQGMASKLQARPLELALCHADIHGGNILISNTGELYIVDWDDPILAPKERDLMFIGGGIDTIWKTEQDEALFYEGYGKTAIDFAMLAYYRYERVIEDLAVICEQLLLSNAGGADRERALGWFTDNFEPGSTIEIAERTYALLS